KRNATRDRFDLVAFLLILNVMLFIVGCLMDILSAILILVPLLAKVGAGLGVHPLHLAVIFIVNLEIGYLTPPVGLNLFVASTIFRKDLGEIIRAVLPFMLLMLGCLLVITYVPTVALGPVALMRSKPPVIQFPDGSSKPNKKGKPTEVNSELDELMDDGEGEVNSELDDLMDELDDEEEEGTNSELEDLMDEMDDEEEETEDDEGKEPQEKEETEGKEGSSGDEKAPDKAPDGEEKATDTANPGAEGDGAGAAPDAGP
ncbi:MAG: TRAP transporter large permease subunit, partial [Myxococcota bacterium]